MKEQCLTRFVDFNGDTLATAYTEWELDATNTKWRLTHKTILDKPPHAVTVEYETPVGCFESQLMYTSRSGTVTLYPVNGYGLTPCKRKPRGVA